jgi:hypothetical protein
MQNLKGCPSSKNKYDDEADALKAARESMLFRNSPELDVYKCLLCDGYHLTSSIKELKVKKNSRRKK